MKYVRTKDGIYDLEKSLFHQYNGIRVLTPYCKQYEENPSLCKTSDTIEELCDEFVVIHKELNGNHTVHRYSFFVKSEQNAGNDVYGAIWTDKGLIFVARANNEGVLELL